IYIDGAFSKNIIEFNKDTILVSPFSCAGRGICPAIQNEIARHVRLSNLKIAIEPENLIRGVRALSIPSILEAKELFIQGYNDALKFLDDNPEFKSESPQSNFMYWKILKLFDKYELNDVQISINIPEMATKLFNLLRILQKKKAKND
ncbi:MAG: 1-acylglycerol-3-phosphate O-acyltransferase pnpla3, partial [Paramarteilia canceri]